MRTKSGLRALTDALGRRTCIEWGMPLTGEIKTDAGRKRHVAAALKGFGCLRCMPLLHTLGESRCKELANMAMR